ncbi:Uncharacterized protein Adt_11441 [Abeliophyllum distichum]|uniref:Uncharacterized protein n=1 Tax=Abeliophyllum distichum TaxID=126358 RepID=A0ABD1UN93_9LAMI
MFLIFHQVGPSPPAAPLQAPSLLPTGSSPPGAPRQASNFPAMETLPTMAPLLAPSSLVTSFAPYIHSWPNTLRATIMGGSTYAISDGCSLATRLRIAKDGVVRQDHSEIKDLQMPAVVTAMMSGICNCPFKISLFKNPPDMMQELLRRGDKYVDHEEAFFITKSMKDRKELKSNKREN